nr:hypothetical protein Iba_chr08dCG5930 [Ipomoea batatas]
MKGTLDKETVKHDGLKGMHTMLPFAKGHRVHWKIRENYEPGGEWRRTMTEGDCGRGALDARVAAVLEMRCAVSGGGGVLGLQSSQIRAGGRWLNE